MGVDTDTTTSEKRAPGRARRIGFLTVVGLTIVMFVAMVPPDITHPVTGWLPDDSYERYVEFFYGDETPANMAAHRHHMLAFSMAIWIVLVGMAVQLRKPKRKQAPLWAAAAAVVMMLVFEITLVGFDPSTLILLAPVLAAVALHPRLLPAEGISWTGPGRAVAVVTALAALVYGFYRGPLPDRRRCYRHPRRRRPLRLHGSGSRDPGDRGVARCLPPDRGADHSLDDRDDGHANGRILHRLPRCGVVAGTGMGNRRRPPRSGLPANGGAPPPNQS